MVLDKSTEDKAFKKKDTIIISTPIFPNADTHVVEFASTITTFGANADIIKPIGIAVASQWSAVCQSTLKKMFDCIEFYCIVRRVFFRCSL